MVFQLLILPWVRLDSDFKLFQFFPTLVSFSLSSLCCYRRSEWRLETVQTKAPKTKTLKEPYVTYRDRTRVWEMEILKM